MDYSGLPETRQYCTMELEPAELTSQPDMKRIPQ
jgi:hypothetical protein